MNPKEQRDERFRQIDDELRSLGYEVAASLSSLDSEDDLDALVDLATDEMVEPPDEHIASLLIEWSELCSEAWEDRCLTEI